MSARMARGRFGLLSAAFRLGHGSVASPYDGLGRRLLSRSARYVGERCNEGFACKGRPGVLSGHLHDLRRVAHRVHSGSIAARNPADDVAYEGRHRNHHGRPLVVFFDVRRMPSSCLREVPATRMRRSDVAGGVHARSQRRHSRAALSVSLRGLP